MPHWLYRRVGAHFRSRRARWFLGQFAACRTVIDLGGTVESWSPLLSNRLLPNGQRPAWEITLVNREPQPAQPPLSFLQADACCVPLGGPFDLAFSNSVIEHVGGPDRQQDFASELLRLGRRVYCQTPNRWFPVEPHFLGLFVHWLPAGWLRRLHPRFTLNGARGRPWEPVRLLTRRDLQRLFPGCHIRVERFLLWPKSFIVWR